MNTKHHHPLQFYIIFLIVGFIIGAAVLSVYFVRLDNSGRQTTQNPFSQTDFPLLSRRIATYSDQDRIVHFVPLRRDLRNFIATQSSTYAVYFEYIPTGNNIGINDTVPFAYASLLKVPLVMTIYKQIETGKSRPSDTLTITEKTLDKRFGSLWRRGIGTTITVQEAIKLTLTESDNTAYQMLRTLVTAEEFAAVFENLDIPLSIQEGEPVVTAKNFTSILRGLYFSSIVTEESSQEILTLLTQSSFKNGIRSPIPENIPVAHKMGVRQETDSLSDCGLVYIPNRPYFLCAISINDSSVQAEQVIQTVSRKVYDYLRQ